MATKKSVKEVVQVPDPTPIPQPLKYIAWSGWGVVVLVLAGLGYLFHPPIEHWRVTVLTASSTEYTLEFEDTKVKHVQFKDVPYMAEGSTWDLDVRKARYEGRVPNSYRNYGAVEVKPSPATQWHIISSCVQSDVKGNYQYVSCN